MRLIYDNYIDEDVEGEVRRIPMLGPEEVRKWAAQQCAEIHMQNAEIYVSPTPPTVALVAELVHQELNGLAMNIQVYMLMRKSTTKTKGTQNKKKYWADEYAVVRIYP